MFVDKKKKFLCYKTDVTKPDVKEAVVCCWLQGI